MKFYLQKQKWVLERSMTLDQLPNELVQVNECEHNIEHLREFYL
jgi:hypothetical protein